MVSRYTVICDLIDHPKSRIQGASEPPEPPWLGRAAALEPYGRVILDSMGNAVIGG